MRHILSVMALCAVVLGMSATARFVKAKAPSGTGVVCSVGKLSAVRRAACALYMQGIAQLARGDGAGAEHLFSAALARDPGVNEAYLGRAIAWYVQRRYREAQADLLVAVARLPGIRARATTTAPALRHAARTPQSPGEDDLIGGLEGITIGDRAGRWSSSIGQSRLIPALLTPTTSVE